jgi:hypothetical protein
VHISTLTDDRVKQRAAGAAADTVRTFFAVNDYMVVSSDDFQPMALDAGKGLEGCAGSTAAIRAMTIHCIGKGIVDFVGDAPHRHLPVNLRTSTPTSPAMVRLLLRMPARLAGGSRLRNGPRTALRCRAEWMADECPTSTHLVSERDRRRTTQTSQAAPDPSQTLNDASPIVDSRPSSMAVDSRPPPIAAVQWKGAAPERASICRQSHRGAIRLFRRYLRLAPPGGSGRFQYAVGTLTVSVVSHPRARSINTGARGTYISPDGRTQRDVASASLTLRQ